jgi:hypothetical protein
MHGAACCVSAIAKEETRKSTVTRSILDLEIVVALVPGRRRCENSRKRCWGDAHFPGYL